jgi:hypothetical protein
MRRVCLYSPADLNSVSGSAIWVQAVAHVFRAGANVEVVVPQRMLERRSYITGALRAADRIELVDPRRQRRWVPPSGLYAAEALDLIEELDRERRFDAIVLRTFSHCLVAIDRPRLRDRLWSTYILEPERDIDDVEHRAALGAIASASKFVVAQSEEMRALLEAAVPAARGKTVLLPPAVPPAGEDGTSPDIAPLARRMFYAGKFHPFYPVPRMIDFLEELRFSEPDLEFHAVGDQIFRAADDGGWADDLERRLASTPGVIWHGAHAREDVIRLLSAGGIALSLWDYDHGSTMNDLVVSTKLLDYCLAGVPVILNRTVAQESILGRDYPLFVDSVDEALPLIHRLLGDADLYRAAARRTKAAARRFSYPAVYETQVAPYLEDRAEARLCLAARPKLFDVGRRVAIPLTAGTRSIPPTAVDAILAARAAVPDVFFCIGLRAAPGVAAPEPGRDPAAELRGSLPVDVAEAVAFRTTDDPWNWWRTFGIALAPSDAFEAVDLDSVALAEASGATVVRDSSELLDALLDHDAARDAPAAAS